MNLPLVSILIISYNQIDFIGEALSSALEQDYDNLEVVVADDGSTDGTDEVINEYAGKYPGRLIALVGGPNLGITGNSNRALKRCKGKYIALQGGDDVFLPGKISAQVKWFESDSERVLCGHQIETFYMDRSPSHLHTRKLRIGSGPRWLIRNGTPYGAVSVMLRAAAIPAHGFDERLPNVSDHFLYIETLSKGGKYGYIDGIFARYRKHSSNITLKREMCIDELEKSLSIIASNYPAYVADCNYAKFALVRYGYAISNIYDKEYSKAFFSFATIVLNAPFCLKAWYRLFQSGWHIMSKKFSP